MKFSLKKVSNAKIQEEQLLQIIDENQDMFYKIAFSYVKNKEDALDIVQEAIYKAYLSYSKIKYPEYLKTWLTRIVINCAIDIINKNNKFILIDKNILEQKRVDTSKEIVDNIDINRALDHLNEKQRTVIILKYYEGMKFSEIASILKSPVSTVKSILYRALNKMKIDLEEVNFDE